jgi:hypothetical protein
VDPDNEKFRWTQLIACTGESIEQNLQLQLIIRTHLFDPNSNFTTSWADGHQTFQLFFSIGSKLCDFDPYFVSTVLLNKIGYGSVTEPLSDRSDGKISDNLLFASQLPALHVSPKNFSHKRC